MANSTSKPLRRVPSQDIATLLAIMADLRTPKIGCPWDIEQNFATIAPYTIEEAYEVAEAIDRGDMCDLRDELGDLLLQVAFHSRMAEEVGAFSFGDVVEAITTKLIRRHPHVYGEARDLPPADVKVLWAMIKAQEKRERAEERGRSGAPENQGILDGVPAGLPAMTRALKIQEKASTVGFDWKDPRDVIAKMHEEIGEVEAAMAAGEPSEIADEIGDLLFVAVNLARKLKVDPETALRGTNAKFYRRFAHVEARAAEMGKPLGETSLDEMEALWREAKAAEKAI